MKIAILVGSYYPDIGGAEIFAQHVAEHMAGRGNHVDVITIRLETKFAEYEQINGVNVYRVNFIRAKYLRFPTKFPALIWQTIKLDRKQNYDVIHSVGDIAIEAGTIVSRLRGKKHLITTQGGGDLMEFISHRSILDNPRKRVISYGLKKANMVHAVSSHMKKKAQELGAGDVAVIPNTVDASKFKLMDKLELRQKYGYSLKESIIISTSRLTPKNGMDDLIRATVRVSQEFSNIRLVIIGEGIQRPELERLVPKLKLESKVELLGWVPNAQIPEYLNMADLFVRPALDEGFGSSFIEAMACHVPVIGSAVGGILDIIDDGRNGLMVSPGDVDDITQKIIKLLSNKELSQRLADEGYRTVQERFTREVVLKQIDSLYERFR